MLYLSTMALDKQQGMANSSDWNKQIQKCASLKATLVCFLFKFALVLSLS